VERVEEMNFGGAAKSTGGVSPYPATSGPARPYDQPLKNRFARGSQPPNVYEPRAVDDEDEEDTFMELDMQTNTMKDQKIKNKIDHVPSEDPTELMSNIKSELSEVVDLQLEIMIHEAFHFLREQNNSPYQKFFRMKLKQWGVNSPSELSDAEKKKFFNSVDHEWQSKKEKKGIYPGE
jgi:hypothetical protein